MKTVITLLKEFFRRMINSYLGNNLLPATPVSIPVLTSEPSHVDTKDNFITAEKNTPSYPGAERVVQPSTTKPTTPNSESSYPPIGVGIQPGIKSQTGNESADQELYRVNYDYNHHSLNYQFYPSIFIPKIGTVIKPAQKGRSSNIGSSEIKFLGHVSRHFANTFKIMDDQCLFVKNKSLPYEPDIVMSAIIDGQLYCIDIEIDEPYSGFDKQPTHCIGFDVQRNIDFLNRGWIVMRFTENQVVESPDSCCKEIATVFSQLIPSFSVQNKLKYTPNLIKEKYWDETESLKFAKDKHREKLLNREFFNEITTIQSSHLSDENQSFEEKVKDAYKEFSYLIKRRTENMKNGTTPQVNQALIDVPKENAMKRNALGEKSTKVNNPSTTMETVKIDSHRLSTASQSPQINKEKNLANSLQEMSSGKTGVGPKGNPTATGKPVIPARHYGGVADKRVFELMQKKSTPFSYALRQKKNVEAYFTFFNCKIENDKLICTGSIHPDFCANYEIRLECEEHYAPRVYIKYPKIEPSNNIHMYPNGSLCLYYPRDLKWNSRLNVADYFIPWAIEWIYCYELFLLTGEWHHEEAPGHVIIDVEKRSSN